MDIPDNFLAFPPRTDTHDIDPDMKVSLNFYRCYLGKSLDGKGKPKMGDASAPRLLLTAWEYDAPPPDAPFNLSDFDCLEQFSRSLYAIERAAGVLFAALSRGSSGTTML